MPSPRFTAANPSKKSTFTNLQKISVLHILTCNWAWKLEIKVNTQNIIYGFQIVGCYLIGINCFRRVPFPILNGFLFSALKTSKK